MAEADGTGPVVVTGGAGAIGRYLVEALAARGREVRVIDNLSTGRRENVPASPHVSFKVADLTHPEQFQDVLTGASEVWHIAANPDIRKGTADPTVDLQNGTLASFNLLEAARRHDVRRALFSSSSAVYGQASVLPTPENYGPLCPASLYGASKLASEALFSAYANSYGMTSHLFRFANVIGPGMTHGIIPDLFAKLRKDPSRLEVLGDGRQAKSYFRIDDCVGGMLLIAERTKDPVNVYNLGAVDRLSVREVAEKVVAATGGRARIEYTGGDRGWAGDIPQQQLAIDKILRLGWKPRYTSAQAVDRTIAELVAATPH
jgi:UDP-glucose 4-epimerase